MEVGAAAQRAVAILDASGVAEARRSAAELAALAGLDAEAAGNLSLGVTEAASNIFKHARTGSIIARLLERGGIGGVEVLALDKGPGMANVATSMRDGHSTAGTPGGGLGALQRMTSDLEVWSRPGAGTLLRFEVWPRSVPPRAGGIVCGAISKAKEGEPVCGDGWTVLPAHGGSAAFVVDGLGHGLHAADAARAAIAALAGNLHREPAAIMDVVHDALRPTRGAAAALALLQPRREVCTFCGIGNISASIRADGKTRSMVSHNGTLGHQLRKIQEFQYPFASGALLVMHSDGIATHWDLAAYPGIEARHPALVAAALFRDHGRGRDDLTVLALRNGERA